MTEHKRFIYGINEALQRRQTKGSDSVCKYYPCHFEDMDCTWCFCPFYPCGDELTGGKLNPQGWACKDCSWLHEPHVSSCILEELLKVADNIETIPMGVLLQIRLRIIQKGVRCENG